jgi:hypothetical protein
MNDAEQHEMFLATTHPTGEEEWLCSTCGRRFLMHWPPAYRKVILEPGDEYAVHSGNKGDLRMRSFEIRDADEALVSDDALLFEAKMSEQAPIGDSWEATEIQPTPLTDELLPWLNWLQDSDLDVQ